MNNHIVVLCSGKTVGKIVPIITCKAGNSSSDKYGYTYTNIMICYGRRDGKTEGKWSVLANVGGIDKVL